MSDGIPFPFTLKTTPLKSPLISAGDDIVEILWDLLTKQRVMTPCSNTLTECENYDSRPLQENSIIGITSKVISVSEGSIRKYSSAEELNNIIFEESDKVLGKSEKYDFYLTEKDGMLLPNAGIDTSNAKEGEAILLPKDSQKSAEQIRESLQKKSGVKNLGVFICDSRVLPFRRGISGIALGWAGFEGVSDERGKKDLYGKELQVSQLAVADNLSSISQIFFGQAGESVPFVVFEDPLVEFTNEKQDPREARIPLEEDLFAEILKR